MVSKRQELSPTKRNVPPTQVKKETGTKIENNRNFQFEWSGFLRNDPRLPNFSNRSPNMEEMFKICLLSKILSERLVKIKLTRVQEAATFVVQQDLINQEHPYDIEAEPFVGISVCIFCLHCVLSFTAKRNFWHFLQNAEK